MSIKQVTVFEDDFGNFHNSEVLARLSNGKCALRTHIVTTWGERHFSIEEIVQEVDEWYLIKLEATT